MRPATRNELAGQTTIYDIAREAGTSPSTVSRVLNGSTLVNAVTSREVAAAAARLNYVSRQIRRPRTRAILHVVVFLPHAARPQAHLFYDAATLVTGIEEGFADVRHHLIVSLSDSTDALNAKKLGDIDGCIFAFCSPSPGLRRALAQRSIPAVLVNRTDRGMSSVSNDAEAGVRKLLGEITRQRPGQRVGFVAVEEAGPVAGYRARAAGSVISRGADLTVTWFESVAAISLQAVERLLTDGIRVFMCVNDYVAIAVWDRLKMLGLSVPEDAGLTGFDAAPVRGLFARELTTVDLAVDRLGAEASRLLVAQVMDRSITSDAVLVAGDLVPGETL